MVIGALIARDRYLHRLHAVGPLPERPRAIQARLAPLHPFFVNKWYFDEAIDFLVVRPMAWFGRFCSTTFERVFVQGALVGGSTGVVRLASAGCAGYRRGYLRYYAALLLMGVTGSAPTS